MRSVPNFALYGTEARAQPSWKDLVHFERIPDRASLFDWEIQPHFHDALIQVLYPSCGSGDAVIDGRRWVLEPPCLIVAPARSVHGFRFSSDIDGAVVTTAQRGLESLASTASPGLLRSIRTPAVLSVDPASRQAEALVPLLEAIERESLTHTQGQVAAGMSLLVALFVQIARLGQTARASEQRETRSLRHGADRSRQAMQIERFRALLDERCRERLTVDACARELGVTPGQLTRVCRELMGMSTLEAINARVVHEAQRELVYSSLSVKQVAAELGFDDEAYFGRFFKKQTGARPTEFRAMARQELAAT